MNPWLTRLWLTQFLISDTINKTEQFLINYLFSNSDMSAHLCMMWMQKCIFKIKWQTLIRLEKPVFLMPALSKWHFTLCRGRYHAIETLRAVNCISKENQSGWDVFLRYLLYMKLGVGRHLETSDIKITIGPKIWVCWTIFNMPHCFNAWANQNRFY